ncbi:Uncharacterized protein FWK35_00011340 [Aphis craccivora]|uniref:Uncharacterized protein n=1 Tax=Aphis craccivora TaxID=307492 RepID=A0A6G0YBE3_APHCR|nr:Uncharacterized protein FWK35_00011340 [Aphis craccivora]
MFPPKYGNCPILDKHALKISVSDIKKIFQGNEESLANGKLMTYLKITTIIVPQIAYCVKQSFTKYCEEKHVFDLVIEDIFEKHKFIFPFMHMRHFSVQDNRKENIGQKKKKLVKLLHLIGVVLGLNEFLSK